MKVLVDAIAELQKKSAEWIGRSEAVVARALERTLANAVRMLGRAEAERAMRFLERARMRMLDCFTLFELLTGEKEISPRMLEEAYRRLDQIVAALDQLLKWPAERWSELVMRPLAPPARRPEDHPAVATILEIMANVAESRRRLQEPEPAKRPRRRAPRWLN